MNENEIEVTATPAGAQAEQVQQVEQVEGAEATTEQTQEQVNESAEDKAKKEPWFQKRIGELTREKYEAKRQAEQAAQELRQYREQLAQVQQGGESDEHQPVANTREAIQQEAARLVAEQSFNATCNKVYTDGKAAFPDFDQAIQNLQAVGASREFYELATTSDASVKLLHHLGNDMDEAARIASLPPVQMARELTRLEYKLNQAPTVKPVSKAPAPIKPIGTGGNTDSALRDDLSADEWLRRRNAKRFK